jgi:hypothetical protein
MLAASPLYPGQERATHHRAAGARALRGAAIRPPASNDEGVSAKIRCTLRDRSYARAGSQSLRAAAMPIYRIGQDPPSARDNSHRRQPGQDRRLVPRYSCCQDALLTLRCLADGRLIRPANSPPVSTVCPANRVRHWLRSMTEGNQRKAATACAGRAAREAAVRPPPAEAAPLHPSGFAGAGSRRDEAGKGAIAHPAVLSKSGSTAPWPTMSSSSCSGAV